LEVGGTLNVIAGAAVGTLLGSVAFVPSTAAGDTPNEIADVDLVSEAGTWFSPSF